MSMLHPAMSGKVLVQFNADLSSISDDAARFCSTISNTTIHIARKSRSGYPYITRKAGLHQSDRGPCHTFDIPGRADINCRCPCTNRPSGKAYSSLRWHEIRGIELNCIAPEAASRESGIRPICRR